MRLKGWERKVWKEFANLIYTLSKVRKIVSTENILCNLQGKEQEPTKSEHGCLEDVVRFLGYFEDGFLIYHRF